MWLEYGAAQVASTMDFCLRNKPLADFLLASNFCAWPVMRTGQVARLLLLSGVPLQPMRSSRQRQTEERQDGRLRYRRRLVGAGFVRARLVTSGLEDAAALGRHVAARQDAARPVLQEVHAKVYRGSNAQRGLLVVQIHQELPDVRAVGARPVPGALGAHAFALRRIA